MVAIEPTDIAGMSVFLHREDLADDPAWIPTRLDGPVVARIEGQRVVGAARLYRSRLHPARWRLAIHVEPSSRRRGIGSALVHAVVAALPDDDARDLQAATGASDEAAVGFLRSQGFDLLTTTRLGSLDADAVPDHWLERAGEARLALARHGIEIVTLTDAPARFRETALLHARIYRAQHGWNPPARITPDRAEAMFLDPRELDPNRQWLATTDDGAIGVASLRSTGAPARVDLGWFGVVDVTADRGITISRALLGTCLASIRGEGTTVSLEIDAIDPATDDLIDELPAAWDDDWLTWRKRR